MGSKTQQGFTLIEAMVVIALMGVLAAMAYPSFSGQIERAALKRAASNVENALSYARMTAIENNQRVSICPADSGATVCAGDADWSRGIMVFEDNGTIGTFSTSDDRFLRFFSADSDKINIAPTGSGSLKWISFLGGGAKATFSSGIGASLTLGKPSGKIKFCLIINQLGRVVRNENCSK